MDGDGSFNRKGWGHMGNFSEIIGKDFNIIKENILGHGMKEDSVFGNTWVETDYITSIRTNFRIPIILCDNLKEKLDKILEQ